MISLDEAKADWCLACRPFARPQQARVVCDEIVRRSFVLAQQNGLDFPRVVAFLLTRTRTWVLGGTPLDSIANMLPTTVTELGTLKMVECSDAELKKASKPRIIH